MLKKSDKNIVDILNNLPRDFKIIDVGGAGSPCKRADYILDAINYEEIAWNLAKGEGDARFTKETFIKKDICDRGPWPFKDKEFDYSVCTHTLEDLRDPLWVCSELIRISKAGFIEIPSKLYETCFNLEMKNLAGACHHRWIVDIDENKKLRFTFKYMQVHAKSINKNKVKFDKNNPDMYLKIEWSDSFSFFENWIISGKDIMEYYLEREITEKEKWNMYRKVDPRNYFLALLSYLKNTNTIAFKIFKKLKKIG